MRYVRRIAEFSEASTRCLHIAPLIMHHRHTSFSVFLHTTPGRGESSSVCQGRSGSRRYSGSGVS